MDNFIASSDKPKIVFTDIGTLGFEIDTTRIKELGPLTIFDDTDDSILGDLLHKEIPDVSIIITNGNKLTDSNLKKLGNLKLICAAATGYDNIDLEYCHRRGIAVTNVPGYATESVAQFTFAMLFHLQFHLSHYAKWKEVDIHKTEFGEISGKTWGIIGLGSIGLKVAEYAKGFGCKVIGHSVTGTSRVEPCQLVTKDELLESSDIISIHAPISSLTKNFITLKELEKMKLSSILLNLGRGGIINENDLALALNEGLIAGAGLDVTEKEPLDDSSPLLKLKVPDRLLITPHIAYASIEARARLMESVYNSIESFLKGGRLNRVTK